MRKAHSSRKRGESLSRLLVLAAGVQHRLHSNEHAPNAPQWYDATHMPALHLAGPMQSIAGISLPLPC